MKKANKILIGLIFALSAICFALASTAQNQDVNPYGGIYYNDHANQRFYGRFALPRTDDTNTDTLTNLIKGSLVFDTLENQLEYVDTNFNWIGVNEGNTLDEAYDQGGAGAGRTIDAVDGAVKISGEDGLLVTGEYGSGADIEYEGGVNGECTVYFNPKKAAFRAGFCDTGEWDDSNVGYQSIALGSSSLASAEGSLSLGVQSSSTGVNSISIGNGLTSESFAETAIGLYNTDYTPTSTSAWNATDRLFVIGNGQSSGTRSDALVILKNGNTGLGTSTPTETLDVIGTAKIHNLDNSSILFRGLYEGLVFGALPLSVSGSGGIDTSGNWVFINYSGADNLTQEVGATNIGIDLVTGNFKLFRLDSNIIQLGLGNILTYPDGSGDVELQLGSNNNNAEWRFRDKNSQWAVKDSAGVDIVAIGETNGFTYVDGNQASGYVLTSDASGNATWTHTFSYGEMGFGDSTATIALTLNTPAWVTNGNNDLWSEGAITLEGITYSNDSLICNADGIYEVNLRISGDLALNDVLKVGVYKNGSLSCTCQGQITSPLAGTVEITYVDILPLSADDVLQVYITNTANSNDFDAISAKMTMHKVGN